MGELCPWPPKGKRDEDLGTRTLFLLLPQSPAGFFASFPEPLQLEINVSSAQLLSRVSLQLWGGQGTIPVSLCSSRGTAGLDSMGSGALGRVLSVPYQHITCSSRKPLSCTHSCGAEGGLWGLSHSSGVQLLHWGQREAWKVREAALPQKQHIPVPL